MKIYLDTCSIQRPMDDKRQLRIRLEAEAIVAIIALCESGTLTLIFSDALLFEQEKNLNEARKKLMQETMDLLRS